MSNHDFIKYPPGVGVFENLVTVGLLEPKYSSNALLSTRNPVIAYSSRIKTPPLTSSGYRYFIATLVGTHKSKHKFKQLFEAQRFSTNFGIVFGTSL